MIINKIGAVVVLYNPTLSEFANIYSYCNTIDELILIDNSPVSNEVTVGKVFFNVKSCEVKYIYNGVNLGLCAGMNKGIQIAAEDGCDWCYTNNPDSRFKNDITSIYKNILEKENDKKIAVLGPQYSYDRRKLKKQKGIYDVEWLMMSGNLVNVSIFLSIGGFDERLFLDGLDMEFCLRLKKYGYRILECRQAVLIHKPAITKEKKILFFKLKYGWDRPERYYYQVRADVYIDQNYNTKSAKRDLLIRLIKIIFLFENKSEYIKSYKNGLHDARSEKWKYCL